MKWSYNTIGEADALSDAAALRQYHVKLRFPYDIQLEAWCNGNCMARVDTISEGINLCEWVERSGNQ